ncbi:hypothetical protein BS78_08G130700 [Paspalum vaginatum]|nr:hypothetical protein BS78_08G130700 [Paspalum vaginatum]
MERSHEYGILSNQRYHEEVRRQHNMEFLVSVRKIKDDEADFGFICLLQHYLYLQRAVFSIDCAGGATTCQVEKIEAAIRHAANAHHNRPTLQLIKINMEEMASPSDHPDTEVDDLDDDLLFFFQSPAKRLIILTTQSSLLWRFCGLFKYWRDQGTVQQDVTSICRACSICDS